MVTIRRTPSSASLSTPCTALLLCRFMATIHQQGPQPSTGGARQVLYVKGAPDRCVHRGFMIGCESACGYMYWAERFAVIAVSAFQWVCPHSLRVPVWSPTEIIIIIICGKDNAVTQMMTPGRPLSGMVLGLLNKPPPSHGILLVYMKRCNKLAYCICACVQPLQKRVVSLVSLAEPSSQQNSG